MSHEGTYRYTGRSKNNMPIAPPATFSDEIRFSEVEVSLYSEFSDDEDEATNNTKSKDDEIIEKEMFSKSDLFV